MIDHSGCLAGGCLATAGNIQGGCLATAGNIQVAIMRNTISWYVCYI